MYEYPHYQTFGAQTEFHQEFYSNPGTETSDSTDASTQVDDKDVSQSSYGDLACIESSEFRL